MQDSRAAKRYALALFEVAEEKKLVSKVEEDLDVFCSLLETEAGFRQYYNSPNASRQAKSDFINKTFTGKFSPLSVDFIRLLISKGRGREVSAIRDEFVTIRQEASGAVSAEITSSVDLSEPQKKTLLTKLEAIIGKKVEPQYALDPRILGGVKVAYGNLSIDGTLKGALDDLRQRFRHDVLKQA